MLPVPRITFLFTTVQKRNPRIARRTDQATPTVAQLLDCVLGREMEKECLTQNDQPPSPPPEASSSVKSGQCHPDGLRWAPGQEQLINFPVKTLSILRPARQGLREELNRVRWSALL